MPSATFSGNGAYRLDVDVWTSGVTVFVSVAVTKTSGSGYWTASPVGWWVTIDGTGYSGNWTYNFTASTPQTIGITSQSKATGGGVRGYSVTVNMASGIGSATVSGSVTASTPPGAPNPAALDTITATSFRYQFSGTTDGGSTVLEWQAQIATDINFTENVVTTGSTGTTTFTGLVPGRIYYVRSRGRNSVGWGEWSGVWSVKTLSGVIVNGVACPVFVSMGGVWKNADVQVSNGSQWKAAG
ncbi:MULTISPECIES: fibronectin type III domain-containing protein [unclassified Microbacterium]|uniref:fibronectin type III domain-containing protein n=1 Tax=unclassified Microbacterium TaxID=2609290 RepID=UPI00214B8C14|nr:MULTISPECIES: fibronectin type III domain-containing protein [unclassified Microbacterium]MCR2785442.1 fibronectin type III domain-containing protein [Microbacterium sp. zg.B96]WIM14531.1 fibronectin type III domain-containing protein [Microbacterium sp. zg-B96]